MNILADDITYTVNFDSPNPEYKSQLMVHGWLETKNTYSLDTKVCFNIYHIFYLGWGGIHLK